MLKNLDYILKNQGLNHIATKIFLILDLQSLINCQLVSEDWNLFIRENNYIWKLQLRKLKSGTVLLCNGNHEMVFKRLQIFSFVTFPYHCLVVSKGRFISIQLVPKV